MAKRKKTTRSSPKAEQRAAAPVAGSSPASAATRSRHRTTPTPPGAEKAEELPFEPDARIKEPRKRAFLIAFGLRGNVGQAAHQIGISRFTHYDWLEKDATYAAEFKLAQEHAGDNLEAIARVRGVYGSDTILIVLLKGLKPDRYRDRHEFTGKDGGPIEQAVVHVSYHKDMEPPPEADIPPVAKKKPPTR